MSFHPFIKDEPGWQTHGDEILFANPHLEIHRPTVTSPTRPKRFTWIVCHRKSAVVIVPMTKDGLLLLIRQERVPIRATIWEFPAGQIDSLEGPDVVRATCLRELREETGCQLAAGGELQSLGHFFPSCGFTDEHCSLVVARPVIPHEKGQELDAHEAITECRAFSVEALRGMIASGEVRDANTLAAFARLVAMRIIVL